MGVPAGVGYDVEADGRRVAKMSPVFREDLFTCTSAKMLFAGFASFKIFYIYNRMRYF